MINELLHDIAELENVVESIKRVNKPETVVAIRTIDLMIERKQDDGQDNSKKEEPLSETITPTAS